MGKHLPETKKRLNAEYRDRNREVLREKSRLRRRAIKAETLRQYGECCAVCGFDDVRALHIDHINDDGNIERASLGGKSFSGWRFYEHLKKENWPEGYQTLCANHNQIKHLGDDF